MRSILLPSKYRRFIRDLGPLMIGKTVLVERREGDWAFEFVPDFVITVGTFWRLIGKTYICVASEDDGHQFGLPAPIDAEAEANRLLRGKAVKSVEADIRTGDLSILLDGHLTINIVTSSAGYESWQMWHRGEFFAFGANGGQGSN